MIDNTTAVAVINHMGTNHSNDCNSIAIKIWSFCFKHNMWLTACHNLMLLLIENLGNFQSRMLNG